MMKPGSLIRYSAPPTLSTEIKLKVIMLVCVRLLILSLKEGWREKGRKLQKSESLSLPSHSPTTTTTPRMH